MARSEERAYSEGGSPALVRTPALWVSMTPVACGQNQVSSVAHFNQMHLDPGITAIIDWWALGSMMFFQEQRLVGKFAWRWAAMRVKD